MALTEEQLALITSLESPGANGSAGGAIAVCELEGLGAPSREDVRAAQLKLRNGRDLPEGYQEGQKAAE